MPTALTLLSCSIWNKNKTYFTCASLNTNITMQYGEQVPQGKYNSSVEVVTFPWMFMAIILM